MPRKQSTNLTLSGEVLREARSLGINISRAAEAGIADAIKNRRRENWLRDNASALKSSNTFVEEHGLPLERYRRF